VRGSNGWRHITALSLFLALHAPAAFGVAEIVSITGKGEFRHATEAGWRDAKVKQALGGGDFVRTGDLSTIALLFTDRTQIRLSQNSMFQVKGADASGASGLSLRRGRAWAQTKDPRQVRPTYEAKDQPGRLLMETPSATAAIRGTDWEMEVDDKGRARLTVLHGEVVFYNEQGSVTVRGAEQALAEIGKAPVKLLLQNPAERVQWVTSYTVDAARYSELSDAALAAAGESGRALREVVDLIRGQRLKEARDRLALLAGSNQGASAVVFLLLADFAIYGGELRQAEGILNRGRQQFARDPRFDAQLARVAMFRDDMAAARKILRAALAQHPESVELKLAEGEIARFDGEAARAAAAYRTATELAPGDARGWHGAGAVEGEKENVKRARRLLHKALELDAAHPATRGELGTLETFASNFEAARAHYDLALKNQPDDYVALTGLGLLLLKGGEPERALENLLRANVIEPKYARAVIYTAVAYYQLGRHRVALETLERAAELDPRDPLPHQLKSIIHFDSIELGRSIEAARDALQRLPYLKSLNQVLNDQKGNANLGSALAAFGMEEWAQAYAYESYSPYWAGSHLFLSDRFSGTFNKNSELFKGFLSDPTVFGASNRFSSLVPVPGHYGSVEGSQRRDFFTQYGINAALNGYGVSPIRFSYSLVAERTTGDSAVNDAKLDGRQRARGENYIAGLGMKPTHELGVFAFANRTTLDGHFAERSSGLIDEDFNIHYHRYDAGLNYKFSPTNQAWLKIGEGSEKAPLAGAFFSPQIAAAFNASPLNVIFHPAGRLNYFQYDQSQRDIQWRHTFDVAGGWQVTWGAEHATEGKPAILDLQFPVNAGFLGMRVFRLFLLQDNRVESKSGYVSGRGPLGPLIDGQVDLHYQDVKTAFATDQTQGVTDLVTVIVPHVSRAGDTRDREVNPRLGLKWRPAQDHTVRIAAQVWRKPPGVNTLAPVDTVGIPIDDQIVAAGGRLKRARVQHEMQVSAKTFAQWFADLKEVSNPTEGGAGIVSDLKLIDLERLRNRQRVYGVRREFLEERPEYGAGRIAQFGLAVNHL
jgi:tetratricopeptide (TPR) repeat protein